MGNVLILAQDFPPKNTIGAQGPCSCYKYFKSKWVNIIFITTHKNID